MDPKNDKRAASPGALELTTFTADQKQALLDLLVLAMYMDGNLARAEEARVQQLLGAMGFRSDYDRNREFDASVTRVRREAQTPEEATACAVKLAGNFPIPAQQQHVYDFLSDIAALDGNVSPEESKFLLAIKAAFKM